MLAGGRPLLLVGAGRMGGALLQRWLGRGLAADQVTVLDPFIDQSGGSPLTAAGVTLAAAPGDADGRDYGSVVLAVKPQAIAEALPEVAPLAPADAVILSVAAGVRIAALEAAFPPGQPVIRTMPNTPAQIGQGVSAAITNAHVTNAQRDQADALLSAVGQVAWIDDEALMDAVTAVSGSGPAYVFLLAEYLAEAGREAGLPADIAALLARQTVAGAGALLGESADTPDELRRNVTSPGGTTAAALDVLMAEDGLKPLLKRAVKQAKRRSIELG